jgi:hypothetical protein
MTSLNEMFLKLKSDIRHTDLGYKDTTNLVSQVEAIEKHLLDERESNPEEDLRNILNAHFGDNWTKFSWGWDIIDDLLSIRNIELDGVVLSEAVDPMTAEDIEHDFYNEVDYVSLHFRGVTEVRRGQGYS